MANGDQFDPVAEYRKSYTDDPRSDEQIAQKLKDPANFRKAFPDYDYSAPDADQRISAHMSNYYSQRFAAPRVAQKTEFEKKNEIPSWYGFTPGNVVKQAWEGVKDVGRFGKELATDISNEQKPLVFGTTEEGPGESTFHKYVIRPSEEQSKLAQRGNQSALESVGHSIAAGIPLIGPWVAGLAQQAGTGDIGGAAGRAIGQIGTAKTIGGVTGKVAGDLGKAVEPETAGRAVGEAVKTKSMEPIKTAVKEAVTGAGEKAKGKVGTALRTETGELKPIVKAGGKISGALIGHATGLPEAGLVGYLTGPEALESLVPERPGAFSTAERRPIPVTKSPYFNPEEYKAGRKAAYVGETPEEIPKTIPRIQIPGEETPIEGASEGRPATWTNERVMELARQGNRDAIAQVGRRGLVLPENTRYVAGDVDFPRIVLNPREVTRFTPEGTPITQEGPIGRIEQAPLRYQGRTENVAEGLPNVPKTPGTVQPENIKLPHPEPVELKPGETTEDRFFNKEKGEWSPERQANHDAIAEKATEGKTPPKDRQPEAVITMGGTGAGKTTLTRRIVGDNPNMVNIDSDANKLLVPEYEGLKTNDPAGAAARVHEESAAISKGILQNAVRKGLDFVYDTSTGGGGDALYKKLKDAGYKVRLVYADIPVEEAIRRARLRAMASEDPINRGRFIPEDVIRERHQAAAQAFMRHRTSPHIDEFRAFDTTTREPQEFFRRVGKEPETVYNTSTLEAIRRKAGEHGAEH